MPKNLLVLQRSCEIKMRIQWIADESLDQIVFSKETFKECEILPQRFIFHFGAWKKEVAVKYEDHFPVNAIGLSNSLSNFFDIPQHLPYEISLKGRNLYLGPVIAFITVTNKKNLTIEKLNKSKPYFADYHNIKGLIYICAVNGIDVTSKTIEGFYYDPNSPDDCPWKPGRFPYPSALYRKVAVIEPQIYDSLITTIGDRIFNGYLFNKEELWEWLSPYPALRAHLPHTKKLTSLADLDEMLSLYGTVYLKQVDSYKARGIIKADRTLEGYHFTYRLKGTKIKESTEEAAQFITELTLESNYLIQQAISTTRYDDRTFDFRVIIQKNLDRQWTCPGIIARFGKKGSIATNFLLAGFALPCNEALKLAFKMNDRQAFLKEQEIIEICKKACESLEQCGGHYGDLGVDVIVDSNLKIWILEINKLHDHKYPLYALKDNQLYLKVVTTPFYYAKSLAKF